MIEKIIKYITVCFFILFPIFYLTITPESYEYNKMMLLVLTTSALLSLTVFKIAGQKPITITRNVFTFPIFFLSAIYLISSLFQSPNIILTLITPLSTSTIVAGFLFFILITYNLESQYIQKMISFLVLDACLISLFVLLQQVEMIPNNSFTPAGTLLSTTMFLAIISVYLLTKIVSYIKQSKIPILKTVLNAPNDRAIFEDDTAWQVQRNQDRAGVSEKFGIETASKENIILYLLAFLLITGTTVFLVIKLATTAKPILLPFTFGWIILLEVLKNIRTFLLGVGPANFVAAFSLTKPVAFNNTPFWNIIFTSSSSFFLNMATETGIFGGLFYIVILLKSIKLLKSPNMNHELSTTITLLFSLLIQVFLPANMTVFITTIILLAAVGREKQDQVFPLHRVGWIVYIMILPIIFIVGIIGYYSGKFYLAEVKFKQSLDATLNNQGQLVYNLQNQAITLNPAIDRYHVAFSRTSLALANAISAKKELSDIDKQNIPNLVKQAIDQARNAILLNRLNEINWDNLGRVYSSLIGYAQGSENWAAYSFQQKLILDPFNPNTYLALTGLNLQLNKFTEAENLSRRAINLKPDLANAHYFLNLSLKGQKKYKEAYTELQKASSLLQADTEDGKKVAAELKELEKLVPKEEVTGSRTENTPNKSQTFEVNEATSSALQNTPDTLPTIALPQIPSTL
ncbi:hypothetical protein HY029_02910 [Candidatus Gottesmanbacteria bacterium]|nr:hypothetical protein [Candidatus Gottesmanbacteria bacterium]